MPEDPVMLLSYVNTQLRDNYSSLEELCASNGADVKEVVKKLESIDYYYDKESNQFK